MTAEQLSKEVNISIKEIERNFPSVQSRMENKGIQLIKTGRGKSADYTIQKKQLPTIYNLDKTLYLTDDIISLPDFSLLTAIALTVEEETFNHKTYQDFLKFLEVEPNIKNIRLLKAALTFLDNQEIIVYKEDKSKKNYFVATWSMKSKEQYSTQLKILAQCRNIAQKEKKSDKYIPYLLKTWIGIGVLKNETTTKKEFCERFKISPYKFEECKKILKKNNAITYNIEKIKIGDVNINIGTTYSLNGIGMPVFKEMSEEEN